MQDTFNQNKDEPLTLLRRWSVNLQLCRGQLDDAASLKDSMLRGCLQAGAKLRQQAAEQFLPHGVTVAMILAESHFVVSTWPEHDFVTLDVAVCDPQLDLQALVQPIVHSLQPEHSDGHLLVTDISTGQSQGSSYAVTLPSEKNTELSV